MDGRKINTSRIPFLNTYIDNLTIKEAKSIIGNFVEERGIHYVVTPNSDIIVKMQEDSKLKQACEDADLILTDGQMLIKISRYLKNPIKQRICMTDFVWEVFDLAVERNYKIFLFGGREEVLMKAIDKIKSKYSTLNIVDSYSPPLGFEKNEEQLKKANNRIKNSGADILIVFLGCPKQEKFIYQNKDKYKVPVSITMGGCVDFIAGSVKRAPVWMQIAGLEWFFRFLQEPKRMFKRYFIDDIRIFGLVRKYKNR